MIKHMFRIFLLLPVLLLLATVTFAQAVGFGTNNPHPSALVDITSTNKGVLVPRLTGAQRTSIAAPAPGLLVYDTDTRSFWFYNGTAWTNLSTGTNPWGTDGNHIFNTNTGRVGIGVQQPTARLTIDSGLVLDYSNSNNILNTVASPRSGLFFGNPATAGISSNKVPGSPLHSGLSFFTRGTRRMIIDTFGRVGIGDIPRDPFQLTVEGSSFLRYIASDYIRINTDVFHPTLLYLKGISTTGWGQHIILEEADGSDSAAILYDGDMKIRVFGTNDNITFRNADNTTTATLSSAGNLTVAGNLVANGNGLVQSGNSSQMQIVVFNSGANLSWTIGPGQFVVFDIGYSGFSSVPVVQPGSFSNATNTSHLLVTATNVTATTATIVVRNVGTLTSVSTNSNFRAAVIGVRN